MDELPIHLLPNLTMHSDKYAHLMDPLQDTLMDLRAIVNKTTNDPQTLIALAYKVNFDSKSHAATFERPFVSN